MKTSEYLKSTIGLPWCQGVEARLEPSTGATQYCAIGRCRVFNNRYTFDTYNKAKSYVAKAIHIKYPTFNYKVNLDGALVLNIPQWNDKVARSQQDVDEIFKLAAELAENEGD